MPRQARLVVPGYPYHLVNHANNVRCFGDDDDRLFFKHQMAFLASREWCAIHAYTLMDNHFHILATPADAGPGKFMHRLSQVFAQRFNAKYRRNGPLWEGRYHSSVVDSDSYFFNCHQYIELNAVRAGMVKHARDYAWSSFRCNALGMNEPAITPHELYDSLGRDAKSRRSAYLGFFAVPLPKEVLEAIRKAYRGNFAFGSAEFIAGLESTTGRKLQPARRGRASRGISPAETS